MAIHENFMTPNFLALQYLLNSDSNQIQHEITNKDDPVGGCEVRQRASWLQLCIQHWELWSAPSTSGKLEEAGKC